MPTVADILRALDESQETQHVRPKLAKQRSVDPDRLAFSLGNDPEALLENLTGRQIALALAKTLSNADFRTLALRVIEAPDERITDSFNADGWSRPLSVAQVMRRLAGWESPDRVQPQTWATVLAKLRGCGYEVRDPSDNPGIHGDIVVRKIFPN